MSLGKKQALNVLAFGPNSGQISVFDHFRVPDKHYCLINQEISLDKLILQITYYLNYGKRIVSEYYSTILSPRSKITWNVGEYERYDKILDFLLGR